MWECGQEQLVYVCGVAVHISTSWAIALPTHHVADGGYNRKPNFLSHPEPPVSYRTNKHLIHFTDMFC